MRKRDAWARFSIFFFLPLTLSLPPFSPSLHSSVISVTPRRPRFSIDSNSVLSALLWIPSFHLALWMAEKNGRKLALPFSSFALSTCICICVCASICARVWGGLWCGYWLAQALWLTPHCPERVKWPKPLAISRNGGTGTEKKLCCCCCC